LVDHFGPGLPFMLAGLLVLGTLFMTASLEKYATKTVLQG